MKRKDLILSSVFAFLMNFAAFRMPVKAEMENILLYERLRDACHSYCTRIFGNKVFAAVEKYKTQRLSIVRRSDTQSDKREGVAFI
ncbi:hypothetical protein IEQ34_018937 [Dendrobium chrysotoxum]|uniref:Secreted protein n=1 Tax=Dendrobium chrysotoxum TaxID=161865 RepID=A0AAV7G8F1_DENCH|nr:hypothetical protein IEQ34_018937 [Dendrobium chrysotoxum]